MVKYPRQRKEGTFMKTRKYVQAALLAALCCVATLIIQVPSPMNGYVNLGDGFVLLSAFLLGPIYGGAAAGIGSMLADLVSGYGVYAPATFIIKFLMAFCAGYILKIKNNGITRIASGIAAEIIMILGYFGFAALLMGEGFGAAASIPGNAMQAVAGIVVSCVLYPLLKKIQPLR